MYRCEHPLRLLHRTDLCIKLLLHREKLEAYAQVHMCVCCLFVLVACMCMHLYFYRTLHIIALIRCLIIFNIFMYI